MFWTRFAARHTWQSINYIIPVIVFAGGAVLYAAGKIYSHARSLSANGDARFTWIEAAGIAQDESCDAAARRELVDRLTVVGQPWCVEVLHLALREERDRSVRKAIRFALTIMSP